MKLYIYLKGNNNQNCYMSVYLDSGITDAHNALESNFKLVVINYNCAAEGMRFNTAESAIKESFHTFTKRARTGASASSSRSTRSNRHAPGSSMTARSASACGSRCRRDHK